ncbi:MAG: hypothetical protein QG622_1653 [Actinomycetota bacterium]|nr:hypothetical protein [Actinomycetota bacterium]
MGIGIVGVLAGVTASPQFGAEDPLQRVDRAIWYHRGITQEEALCLGWAPDAAGELAWHAVGVDLYSYHLLWHLIGGPRRWRGARWSRAALPHLHFDNLPTSTDVEEVWSRVLGGTRVALEWARLHEDVPAARQAVGAGLHAIQDFYSHSTWINAPARRERTWIETRGDTHASHGLDDLSTGGYGAGHPGPFAHGRIGVSVPSLLRLPGLRGQAGTPLSCPDHARPPRGLRHAGPAGINLDSRWQAQAGALARRLADLSGDEAFDLALGLAARDTRTWLAFLDDVSQTGPAAEFWRRVRTGPAATWTDAYDRPTALCYQFLAAGRDLPAGRGDAGRWFLRIDPTPGDRGRPVVEVTAADGRVLAVARPPRRAITVGPLPPRASGVRLRRNGAHRRIQIHAFRRAPVPELRLILDSVSALSADTGTSLEFSAEKTS